MKSTRVLNNTVLRPALFLAILLTAAAADPQQPASVGPPKPPVPLEESAPAGPKLPVYVYLYARITDHVNVNLSEDRLRRLLPALERYRKQYPDAHVSATVFFSGAASEALLERNPTTHIRDFVMDFIRNGTIEPGYDGSDEPTYSQRPVLDFSAAKTGDARWRVREALAKDLLTQARDPLTGNLRQGESGGLEKMQQVFGEAVCITGVALNTHAITPGGAATAAMPPGGALRPEIGDEAELVRQISLLNTRAIMPGLLDANVARLAGFGGAKTGFGQLMSPDPDTSPDLFWQDHVLRTSESTDSVVRMITATDGPDAFKRILEKADRSRIRVVHVELAEERNYLAPSLAGDPSYPLKYAYSHPNRPNLPPDAFRSSLDVESAYGKQDEFLRWLFRDAFPANSGSRCVSSSALKQMAHPPSGFSVTVASLSAALTRMLARWGNDTFPPANLLVDGHYLSLADMFQVMTDALAEFNKTGQLPQSVKVIDVYGPVRVVTGHGPNTGEVTVAAVARACAALEGALHDTSPDPVPQNAIPTMVSVDGLEVNSAQFLRLMAAALVSPSPEAKLQVRMTYMFAGPAALIPKSRPLTDLGGSWTIKPAQLAVEQGEQKLNAPSSQGATGRR